MIHVREKNEAILLLSWFSFILAYLIRPHELEVPYNLEIIEDINDNILVGIRKRSICRKKRV